LDKATQAQLNRGRRLVEVLKQDQYAPLPVEKQILIIFAGTSGYLDDLEISQCAAFEREMYKHFDVHHADLVKALGAKEGLTDELRAALRKAMDEFKETFKATQVEVTA
jgi:F-type H+-transporting ATPase subunit alpha